MTQVQMPKLLFVSIFKHHWHTTGSWKNASGVLESPGNFLTKTVGTLVIAFCSVIPVIYWDKNFNIKFQ